MLVEQTLHTKIHTETCWRENAFTQTFSFTNVHRANFLPKPSRPCQECPASRPSAPQQQSAMVFSTIHLGHFTISLRPTQRVAAVIPAKRFGHSSKTPRPFHRNAPAFSAKHLGFFSETPRPFHQKETPDGAGFLPVPRPVPGCPDYSPVFTSCRSCASSSRLWEQPQRLTTGYQRLHPVSSRRQSCGC